MTQCCAPTKVRAECSLNMTMPRGCAMRSGCDATHPYGLLRFVIDVYQNEAHKLPHNAIDESELAGFDRARTRTRFRVVRAVARACVCMTQCGAQRADTCPCSSQLPLRHTALRFIERVNTMLVPLELIASSTHQQADCEQGGDQVAGLQTTPRLWIEVAIRT